MQRARGGARALMAGTAAGQVQVREGVVISEKMKERAARLIADTNIIITAYLESLEDHPIEAINVADLGCRHVRFCLDDLGEWWEEVVIEEADPGCVSFNTHVTNRLRDMGHENAHSVTEW